MLSALKDAERRFLEELNARGVRYMLVGLSAAILQGANTLTQDRMTNVDDDVLPHGRLVPAATR